MGTFAILISFSARQVAIALRWRRADEGHRMTSTGLVMPLSLLIRLQEEEVLTGRSDNMERSEAEAKGRRYFARWMKTVQSENIYSGKNFTLRVEHAKSSRDEKELGLPGPAPAHSAAVGHSRLADEATPTTGSQCWTKIRDVRTICRNSAPASLSLSTNMITIYVPPKVMLGECAWTIYDDNSRKMLGVALFIAGFCSVVLNAWLLGAFLKSPLLNQRSMLTLLNLCVACLVRSLVGGFVFAGLSAFYNRWLFDDTNCIVFGFLRHFIGVYQIEALTHMSIERYVMAKYYKKERKIVNVRHVNVLGASSGRGSMRSFVTTRTGYFAPAAPSGSIFGIVGQRGIAGSGRDGDLVDERACAKSYAFYA
ncbi:Rhodopsin, GQ-coupled [Eumeta japonica]|uniref:Rhodopsin, GQ-coupled n=1 Tax=Eumeta variegata TaxID=151549 RepID=A0A4C1UXD8_EUMVA|nr:Rhodopsin, GQ-coupled [Eumeta japonica]